METKDCCFAWQILANLVALGQHAQLIIIFFGRLLAAVLYRLSETFLRQKILASRVNRPILEKKKNLRIYEHSSSSLFFDLYLVYLGSLGLTWPSSTHRRILYRCTRQYRRDHKYEVLSFKFYQTKTFTSKSCGRRVAVNW